MKVLFWGTPEFAVPSLRALTEEGHEVVGVVTQPDRPAGRGRSLRSSPVKLAALADGIDLLEPEGPHGEDFLGKIGALSPDLSVVVAYGRILRREVLEAPPRGSINVHASLLPSLRGAAPINWAIIQGMQSTGVTVMRMVERMDAGPILFQIEEPIAASETASDLSARLSEVGAQALIEALALLEGGALEEQPQDEDLATFAPKIGRESARVDWTASASEVANLVRGMDAVPGAWSMLESRPVKLFRPIPDERSTDADPGSVLEADGSEGLLVAAGTGAVRFIEVQPEGKGRMPAAAWIRGRGATVGQRFE
ncbi:MAG: methionyl-tRNA formyltransferase [Longimicrobiales bacterium]